MALSPVCLWICSVCLSMSSVSLLSVCGCLLCILRVSPVCLSFCKVSYLSVCGCVLSCLSVSCPVRGHVCLYVGVSCLSEHTSVSTPKPWGSVPSLTHVYTFFFTNTCKFLDTYNSQEHCAHSTYCKSMTILRLDISFYTQTIPVKYINLPSQKIYMYLYILP